VKHFNVQSIKYVYDPEAAEKWFEIWVDLVLEELLKSVNKSGGEDSIMEEVLQ
jgi:hypothetical protein